MIHAWLTRHEEENIPKASSQIPMPSGALNAPAMAPPVPPSLEQVRITRSWWRPTKYNLSALGLCAAVMLPFWFLYHPLATPMYWILAAYFGLPFVAIVAYALRRTHRLLYGMVEFAIGGFLGVLAIVPNGSDESKAVLACVAAVYLMVRALDNIERGFLTKKALACWHIVFGDDKSTQSHAG